VSSAVMFAAMIRWKLLDCGGEIAFAPAAQVWHHRRRTVRGYLRQQRAYGRAERMLLGAHPQRFNRLGQARWRGVIYGGASVLPSLLRPVVYHGYLGSAPFQPVAKDRAAAANMWIGAFVPFTVPLAALGLLLGVLVSPWWALLPVLMAAALVSYGAAVAIGTRPPNHEPNPRQLGFVVGMLHVAQPFVRMWGRLRGSPFHAPPTEPVMVRRPARVAPRPEHDLRSRGCHVVSGSPSERWDIRVTVGPFVGATITTAVMWRWEPRSRVTLRARPLLAMALLAVIAASFASLVMAAVLAVASAVVCVAEIVALRQRIDRSLEFTTLKARQ
jgi:O-antigen biosynthesis protein